MGKTKYDSEAKRFPYNKWRIVGTWKNVPQLPYLPGVYVMYYENPMTREKDIQYIGRSTNFYKRFSGHRVYARLQKKENLFDCFLMVKVKHTNDHKQLEKELIQRLRPKCNKFFNWGYR